MATAVDPNKTKIAKRVIEIFELFSESGPSLTVMDIVRRYGRPQSSTSELLSCLVEMGLLYKDPYSRAYAPTPRMAALGASCQPEIIRDGTLFTMMDHLAETTGRSIALFGLVGVDVQIFRLSSAAANPACAPGLGTVEKMSASAAGLLLLATFAPDYADRTLWRLYAEADAAQKFNLIEAKAQVAACRSQRTITGPAGFSTDLQLAATLIPRSYVRRPLALGMLYPAASQVETGGMIKLLNDSISECISSHTNRHWANAPKQFQLAS